MSETAQVEYLCSECSRVLLHDMPRPLRCHDHPEAGWIVSAVAGGFQHQTRQPLKIESAPGYTISHGARGWYVSHEWTGPFFNTKADAVAHSWELRKRLQDSQRPLKTEDVSFLLKLAGLLQEAECGSDPWDSGWADGLRAIANRLNSSRCEWRGPRGAQCLLVDGHAKLHKFRCDTQAEHGSQMVDAAAEARVLLGKLSCHVEITDDLNAEIVRVEQVLWDALFPGAPGGSRP